MTTKGLSTKTKSDTLTAIDTFIENRKHFIDKVNNIVVEGKDYHVIKDRKSLAKGGAEKIASIFGWVAEFVKDTETLDMLGDEKGTLAYVCNLKLKKKGQFVGQGRGARKNTQDNGDVNKTIKMAQKSAYIDAVIRASGLSDIFTQDLEDMNGHEVQPPIRQPYRGPRLSREEAREKADRMINEADSLDDLMVVDGFVKRSVNLTDEDKEELGIVVDEKRLEFDPTVS